MIFYVDSSVVVRRILREPGGIDDWSKWAVAGASALMPVEVHRTLDRMRVLGQLRPADIPALVGLLGDLTAGFEQIPVVPRVLRRASAPFATPVTTLDAIHLASALLWMEARAEELTFVTHRRQLAAAARACGLEVRGAA